MKISSLFIVFLIFTVAVITITTPLSCQHADEDHWNAKRAKLVNSLAKKGITDKMVLNSMMTVPRHEFVPKNQRSASYADHPLPIGHSQTISQPYIVAYMCQALKLTGNEKVLEIGTGSGYHAAVLSLLSKTVYTIEIIPELGNTAAKLLDELGYVNVKVKVGDGYQGWQEFAPFDAVILTAAPPQIPQPLLDQLNVGGRLLAPVGVGWQKLVLVERTEDGFKETELLPVVFVPMTGEAQQNSVSENDSKPLSPLRK